MKYIATLAPLSLIACSQGNEPPPEAAPQDQFWAALSSHCDKAYNGALVSSDEADADMQGAEMVMHVRTCDDDTITVPFHIKQTGEEWNRSRTWVFTRTENGIRLKHDHRHEDGKSDDVTMYGGDTADAGTATKQDFPVDPFSIDMFKREGLDVSVTNIWSVSVDPAGTDNAQYVYHLQRSTERGAPEDRNFRVVFDLTNPVGAPPAPWGFGTDTNPPAEE
ncbi:hypothetical protein GRI35_03310 [Altererythrobacter aestiaquae]|uniref:Lipoprotein n=1 Tax=Pontixanthobacter aestiaquae TaxID=1509367 RepID=A0A844Z395_9SPHN|nr:hypothetical protein [Pontixanthobacter aestiaquae]